MKILELTNYSAGGCGVWHRVKQESQLLAKKGHKVRVFSSYFTKGSKKLSPAEEMRDKVRISRFPALKLGGEAFMLWNFEKEALEFKPDIIIAHSYRHFHTHKAIKIAKKINAKVFLVTHAPFERNETRSIFAKSAVWLCDSFIGKTILNKFDNILTITKWELPYLHALGVEDKKIKYIPNGIKNIYFKSTTISPNPTSIIYTGRVSSIKNLELAINALSKVKKPFTFTIYGPAEKEYLSTLKEAIKTNHLEKNIKILNKSFNSEEQISILDKHEFFILPSKSEGMPQSLIEAMARGKICIASNNLGNADLIKNKVNGFLFENKNKEDLAKVLNIVLSMNKKDLKQISKNAKDFARQFNWKIIIKKLESLF